MTTESNSFTVTRIGIVNWLGLWTLLRKEVMRFLKVGFQTILAPALSSLMFLLIFKFAFGAARPTMQGVSFSQFLVPGLIMMGMLNQAFANTASSLIIAKVQGNVVDFLMPPLSALELFLGFVGGAVMRGLIVGLVTALSMMLLVDFHIIHIWAVLWFALQAVLMMGMIGLLAGVAAGRFDHLAAIQNFVLLPLTMLSGTFYSIKVLPESFQQFSLFNPFFYLIDGFRYGFTGVSDGSIANGIWFVLTINLILAVACYIMLRSGWRLKT
ncbi:Efflux ABC transporter, permease protein [hydrothermal vent metagenome]|uniref:Efflux ABC transporter, permease protein n=1 Tax=hydrothermal vent metagenome TaxID=652676 RepID=A0A3B0S376_9ZZZZ